MSRATDTCETDTRAPWIDKPKTLGGDEGTRNGAQPLQPLRTQRILELGAAVPPPTPSPLLPSAKTVEGLSRAQRTPSFRGACSRGSHKGGKGLGGLSEGGLGLFGPLKPTCGELWEAPFAQYRSGRQSLRRYKIWSPDLEPGSQAEGRGEGTQPRWPFASDGLGAYSALKGGLTQACEC